MNFWKSIVSRLSGEPDGRPAPDDDYWYSPKVRRGVTGVDATPTGAIQSAAVWACITLISETIATLPLHIYKRLETGKERAPDHPLSSLLAEQPNAEQTAVEFWCALIQDALRYGNGYARIRMAGRNIESMTRIHPCRVVLGRDRDTDVKFYRVSRPIGEPEILFDDDVFHLPGVMVDADSLGGVSPLTAHRRQVELDLAADEFKLRFLANNAAPGFYFSHPARLSDAAKESIRKSWSQIHGGIYNAGKPGVLEEGLEIKTVQQALSKDMEFLAGQKYSVEQIARIYRVPLHMIQSLDHATNNNIEHQGIAVTMYTFRPWCERIEQRIRLHLMGPTEGQRYFAEFNMMGLLRGDSAARAAYYQSMRNSGIITANEIRGWENLNPIEGGDELMIQGAMVPISMAGQQQNQAVQK